MPFIKTNVNVIPDYDNVSVLGLLIPFIITPIAEYTHP